MRIGLAFDLKDDFSIAPGAPEDICEEYDSMGTVRLIESSLKSLGHEVLLLGGGRNFLSSVLGQNNVNIVFNIAEGRGAHPSREAQVPAVLEMLDIPYTGSSPASLCLCLDKPLAKTLFRNAGVVTPDWKILTSQADIDNTSWETLYYPFIAKPAHEGSSIGVHADSLVKSPHHARSVAGSLLAAYRQPVILEEYISGAEVTVAVVGNESPRVFGSMAVMPRSVAPDFIYSVEVKRDYVNLVDYKCPPKLDKTTLKSLEENALKAYAALGCRDIARLDFRINPTGVPYLLEINPLPGLGSHSDLVIMAGLMGITHANLIAMILSAAFARYPQCCQK
ncbi:MAG: D-alanine--D-alanine ligase [Dehalococcoidaceae bacterium]|nr:D-alanine--D-alanine ligase [Dehalococcoidaceae bacterium]